jgi:DNA-binding HxlR family transcriptional regulator
MESGSVVTVPSSCVLSPAVDVVFGRWTAPILWALQGGRSMRFSELQTTLAGVSPKVLTQRLRQLEIDGLVTRTYYAEMPPRVEYTGTPLADTLKPVFLALGLWSVEHLGDVLAARSRSAGANQATGAALA